ncbi:MAG: hypothetical protein FWB71_06155 [Defluviitaleaceae bacterium]|nr:hypothetical protein [Defluviitaleaceae bacterium]
MDLTIQINDLIDQLDDSDKLYIVEILKRMIHDDVATPEDIMDIALARAERAQGESVSFDDFDWN